MPSEQIAVGNRTCPGCGREYQRLSRHWTESCGHPPLPDHVHDALTGVLLAGGAVIGNGTNKHLLVSTEYRAHAGWVAEQLGWLTHSVRRVDRGTGVQYRVRSHAHAQLTDRYQSRWYDQDGDRRIPADVALRPTAGRVWWSLAGGLQWPHEDDPQVVAATWSAQADAKAAGIQRVLAGAGFDGVVRAGKRVQLATEPTRRWLDWIGEPAPGVVYKWCLHRDVYEAARQWVRDGDPVRTPGMTKAEWYRAALRMVADTRGLDRRTLTREAVDESVAGVDADEVGVYLGGGDWPDALSVAGVPADRGPDHRIAVRKYSREDIVAAVRECASVFGEPLSSADYQDWAGQADDRPSLHAITSRKGSWSEACDAAGVEDVGSSGGARREYDESDVVRALRQYAGTAGEPVRYKGYVDWSVGRESIPSSSVVADRVFSSWVDACEAAGVEPAGAAATYVVREEVTRELVLESIGEVAARTAKRLTVPVYEAARGPGEPSRSAIYRVLSEWPEVDGWRDLVELAVEGSEE